MVRSAWPALRYGLAFFPSVLIIVVAWGIAIWLIRQGLPFIAVLVAIGPPALVGGFLSFDEIVKFEYAHHHDAWVRDGKPSGFYWRTRECHWWNSGFAMQRMSFVWLFRTPDWARNPSPAHVWLVRFRAGIFGWNGLFLIGFAWLIFTPQA